MGQMTKEARLEKAKYMREWRKQHPEKQREYEARKWQKVAEKKKQAREQEAAE